MIRSPRIRWLTAAISLVLISSAPLTFAEGSAHTYKVQTKYQECAAGKYKNTKGNCVKRPAKAPTWPVGASAKCWDNTYSYSQSRRGTCSHHGGVATWRN